MEQLSRNAKHIKIYLYIFVGALLLGSLIVFHSNSFEKLFIPVILIFTAFCFFIFGLRKKELDAMILSIFLVFGVAAVDFIFYINQGEKFTLNLGFALISLCVGLIAINLLSYLLRKKIIFWFFPVFIMIFSAALLLISNSFRLIDFVFTLGVGLGVSLLGCGLYWKLFGLVIPGSILIGSCAGVYFAWAQPFAKNALVQTGVMLVWMALGWGLVTIFSRVRTYKFLWWPLIPGGVFAMVGWGLYIGGNPGNALPFIGNTGSIGLLIFGIYILLLRRGIHR